VTLENNNANGISPEEMAMKAEALGIVKVSKPLWQSFYLSITAGVFIAIAFVFYTTVTTGSEGMPYGLIKFIGGIAFSLGLILVVVCGSELFTSSTLTLIARANKHISTSQVLKNWLVVYVGNALGAIFIVLLIWLAQQHFVEEGAWGVNAMSIAQHKIHHSFTQAVALGILCNVMVCLAILMAFTCKSVTDKVIVMLLPISMFVASGFEHCIANLFMIPLGIIIKTFASAEFWSLSQGSPELFNDLTFTNFVVNNLIPVTIGNIIGGALIGLAYWKIYLSLNTTQK
jgi:formate transporter